MEAFCSKIAQHIGVAKVRTRPRSPIWNWGRDEESYVCSDKSFTCKGAGDLGYFLKKPCCSSLFIIMGIITWNQCWIKKEKGKNYPPFPELPSRSCWGWPSRCPDELQSWTRQSFRPRHSPAWCLDTSHHWNGLYLTESSNDQVGECLMNTVQCSYSERKIHPNSPSVSSILLMRGMLMLFPAATAMKGTNRPTRGGRVFTWWQTAIITRPTKQYRQK